MKKEKYEYLMYSIVQSLCDKIHDYYKIDYNHALKEWYNSKLYSALEYEEAKFWYFSSYDLFRMFKEENEKGNFSVNGV